MISVNTKSGFDKAGKVPQTKPGKERSSPPQLLNKVFPLIWFAIAAFILFGQSVSYHYTFLDDHTLIRDQMERLMSPSSILPAFSEDAFHSVPGKGFYYRPLLTLSFIADAMIGRGNFAIFHISNILYHILATYLLFLVFVALGYDRMRALLFGLLFLVHPLVTQAVAWVPGRNDTLLAIFVLGSFLFWLKYYKSGHYVYAFLHVLFYLAALFTKETAIALPLMILLHGRLVLRIPLKKFGFAATAWLIITAIWAMLRHQVVGGANKVPVLDQIHSIYHNLPALLPFLGKIFFPVDLAVYPILADMQRSTILGIIAIGVLLFLVWMTRPKQWGNWLFGLAWFLAFLVPSFITIGNHIPNFSEHRVYLPLAGILFFIIACSPVKKANFPHLVAVLLMAGLCMGFSIITFRHNRYFRDHITFWNYAVESSPGHAFNYNNLGAMYFLEGDHKKAEPLFRKALQINPNEPMANSNTGLVCMNTNRPAEAEKYYMEEIRINPSYEHAYFNLGLLYYNHGRLDEGISQWEKVVSINPQYFDGYKALLFAYEKLNRWQDYDRITMKARENGYFQ